MTAAQIQQALDDAQARSVAAYLRRQQLEVQRQQVMLAAQQVDHELVLLDGELRALTALKGTAQAHGE